MILTPGTSWTRWRLILMLLPALASYSDELTAKKTLDDYPPDIANFVISDFSARRQAIAADGPDSIKDLVDWRACTSKKDNAYSSYQKAFRTKVLSEQVEALAEAAARPCFACPLSARKLKNYDAIYTELFGNLRDATRILADETRIRLTSGDTDGALDMLCAGLRMLDHMAQPPFTTLQLTRFACQGLLIEAFRDTLASVRLDNVQLTRLKDALDRAYHPDALARTWICDRILDPETDPFADIPAVYFHDAQRRAQLLAARTAVAVEQYRLSHGTIPATLQKLVPEFLKEVPLDPMNGESLRYATNDGYYTVYSVDTDGEPMEDPFSWTRDDSASERTMVSVPIAKKLIPLQEMSLVFDHRARDNTRVEMAAMRAISKLTISAFFDLNPKIVSFSAGPLDGGTAVLLVSVTPDDEAAHDIPIMAGFWVDSEIIYGVNPKALNVVPGIAQAPEAITFTRLRDVVH